MAHSTQELGTEVMELLRDLIPEGSEWSDGIRLQDKDGNVALVSVTRENCGYWSTGNPIRLTVSCRSGSIYGGREFTRWVKLSFIAGRYDFDKDKLRAKAVEVLTQSALNTQALRQAEAEERERRRTRNSNRDVMEGILGELGMADWSTEYNVYASDEGFNVNLKRLTAEQLRAVLQVIQPQPEPETVYINTNEIWGGPHPVTIDDYMRISENSHAHYLRSEWTQDANGIYLHGERVAVPQAAYDADDLAVENDYS